MKLRFLKQIGVVLMILTTLAMCGCGQKQEPAGSDFRAAMAIADITPTRDVYLDGYEAHDASSLAIYPTNQTSDLKARILILDNGTDRLVFLNFEMVFADSEFSSHSLSEGALNRIAEACQTTKENVLLSNTHNHQSYMVLAEEQEDNILNAVKDAYRRLVPAKMGTTTVTTAFGISRGGDYTMDANAPYDSLMSIVRFDEAETGKAIGLIYSVPMHNTMFGNGPGLKVNHNLLSCEFTGYASRAVESAMQLENPNFTAMHINGFYGNAGPYAGGRYYAGDVAELRRNGENFGQEILSGFRKIVTENVRSEITTDLIHSGVPTNKSDQKFRQQFGDYDEMPLRIKLGAFGDICFVGVNYEPFSIIGARLKAEAPYRTLLPAGNVNGWQGYIPTKETIALHEAGHYQAECVPTKTPFDSDGEESFYGQVLDAVCNHAGVTLERIPMEATGMSQQEGTVIYEFAMPKEEKLDKLVISFGQEHRTDCASVFELLVFDGQDQLVYSQEFNGTSVNYLGVFLDGRSAARAALLVRERYGSGQSGIASLSPELYGISFQ